MLTLWLGAAGRWAGAGEQALDGFQHPFDLGGCGPWRGGIGATGKRLGPWCGVRELVGSNAVPSPVDRQRRWVAQAHARQVASTASAPSYARYRASAVPRKRWADGRRAKEGSMATEIELRRHTDSDGDVLTQEGVPAALEVGADLRGGCQLLVSSGAQRATQTLACFACALDSGCPVGHWSRAAGARPISRPEAASSAHCARPIQGRSRRTRRSSVPPSGGSSTAYPMAAGPR
jgi:hypothetical protein